MIYVEIDGEKYPCEIDYFHTQLGSKALRIKSVDAPVAENGFKIYNEENLVADNSDFIHLYREDGNIKEYTKDAEDIIEAEGYISDIPVNSIQRQLSAINNRINEITPYTMSKEAGIQDRECFFEGQYKDGVISATVITSRGDYIPCTIEKSADNITVKFEELTDVATVTVSIQ